MAHLKAGGRTPATRGIYEELLFIADANLTISLFSTVKPSDIPKYATEHC